MEKKFPGHSRFSLQRSCTDALASRYYPGPAGVAASGRQTEVKKSLILLCLGFGATRLGLYWLVEFWLRAWHVSDRASDFIHSMISTVLFGVVGWLVWQLSARAAVQRFIDDQVRNGLQIVRYLEALETDPAKRSALHAVDVKFAGSDGNGRGAHRLQLVSAARNRTAV